MLSWHPRPCVVDLSPSTSWPSLLGSWYDTVSLNVATPVAPPLSSGELPHQLGVQGGAGGLADISGAAGSSWPCPHPGDAAASRNTQVPTLPPLALVTAVLCSDGW